MIIACDLIWRVSFKENQTTTCIKTLDEIHRRSMKNKLKTRSSAKKRYKKTGTWKFVRRKAFKGHILEKKSPKRKRNLKLRECVSKGDSHAIKLMLPYN